MGGAIRTTTRTLAIAACVTVAVNATAPASGAAPGHKSCKQLGALTVSEAHDGTLVPELQGLPRGTVDDLIAVVQIGGSFGGAIVPPFCEPK